MSATHTNASSPSAREQSMLSRGLAVVALVGLGTVLGSMLSTQPSTAHAQVGIVGGVGNTPAAGENQGLVSAADQRKTMIDELRAMSSRMERLEALLSKGLTVKVSEMPARERGEDREKSADKTK